MMPLFDPVAPGLESPEADVPRLQLEKLPQSLSPGHDTSRAQLAHPEGQVAEVED